MSDLRKFIIVRINGRTVKYETTYCLWCRDDAICSACYSAAMAEAAS